jgi:hypothetical protein
MGLIVYPAGILFKAQRLIEKVTGLYLFTAPPGVV